MRGASTESSKGVFADHCQVGTHLRAEVIEIEALARAAEAAADALPAPATDQQRLVFGRIQSLATKTSQQASESLEFANLQIAALTAHMEARRKAAGR